MTYLRKASASKLSVLIVIMLVILALLSNYSFNSYAAEVQAAKERYENMDTKDAVALVYLDEKADSPYAQHARQTMNEAEARQEAQRVREAKALRKKLLKERKARKLKEKKLKEKREKERAAKIARKNSAKTTGKSTDSIAKWDGRVLSPAAGAINGPSGRETYYNLDMSGVVSIMRGLGFSEKKYPYAVRADGVKTLGGYVMVAANLDLRPKGTLIETSLGTGIVVDTGGFAAHNRTQLDIATNW